MVVEEGVHPADLLGLVQHTMDEVYTIRHAGGSGLAELELPGVGVPLPFKVGPEGIVIL